MSRTSSTSGQRALIIISMLALGAAVVGVGLLLQEYGPGNMGRGFLQGALAALLAVAVVAWRVSRHPDRVTTFERAWTQTGDERDDALLTRALAVLGILAFPVTSAAVVAIALGAHTPMVLFLLLVAQPAILAIAFLVYSRRN